MIIGNQQAQEAIAQYFQTIQSGGEVTFPFLLLCGPQHIGKTSAVESYIHDMLGTYIQNDYLPIYDMSEKLGKKHSLKIEVAPKDQRATRDEGTYLDMGARDIVKWLSLSPTGTHKIVFLENIDRMTIGAANALLKTREEPLANRLIIATTANKAGLLDTILSRAFTIQFQLPPANDVLSYLATWYPEKSEEQRLFAASFSLGRVGLARQLLDQEDQTTDIVGFSTLLDLAHTGSGSVSKTYHVLQGLSASTSAEQVIDAVVYACMHRDIYEVGPWMKTRTMLESNVNKDTLLFHLATCIC